MQIKLESREDALEKRKLKTLIHFSHIHLNGILEDTENSQRDSELFIKEAGEVERLWRKLEKLGGVEEVNSLRTEIINDHDLLTKITKGVYHDR